MALRVGGTLAAAALWTAVACSSEIKTQGGTSAADTVSASSAQASGSGQGGATSASAQGSGGAQASSSQSSASSATSGTSSASSSASGGAEGALCQNDNECQKGLKCCYPCGMPGCKNQCIKPFANNQCPMFP